MNVAPSSANHLQMRSDPDRPDCERAMLRLWEFLDDELAQGEADAVGRHLMSCERCYPGMMAARRMLSAVAATRWAVRASDRLRDRVARLRRTAQPVPGTAARAD